jgi:hypothetical protein
MKKFLGVALGLGMCLALAMPASAIILVYGDIEKDKDIEVVEYVFIDKTINIQVTVVATPEGAAEATALVNQDVVGNAVVGTRYDPQTGLPIPDPVGSAPAAQGNFRTAIINGSILANIGIVGVNQDAGNMNNQGNNYAIAVTDVSLFAEAESAASQLNAFNRVRTCEGCIVDDVPPIVGVQKENDLLGSMNLNFGIVSANQSVGNMNNQLNSVAVAAGIGAGVLVAMAEADLGQFNAVNTVQEVNTNKLDLISSSLNGNHGITSFNQSAGNMNNQANIVSISFTHP